MIEEYLGPLLAVTIGWLLRATAAGWRFHHEKKDKIGRLLSELLRIHGHLSILNNLFETLKTKGYDAEQYESLRQRLLEKHFLEPVDDISSLRKLIKDISGSMPVSSPRILDEIDNLVTAKGLTFSASVAKEDLYIRFIAAHESGLSLQEKTLRKEILHLAWYHSFWSYLRTRRYLKSGARNRLESKRSLANILPDDSRNLRDVDS